MERTEPTQLTHAGGIVWRRRPTGLEFLLVRPTSFAGDAGDTGGVWVLPKGHIERGEDAESAALREVLEEAGAVVELGELAGVIAYQAGGKRVRCALYAMEVRAQRESLEQRPVRWATLDEVRASVPFPETVAVVEHVAARAS